MPDNTGLIGDNYYDFGVFVEDNTLASKPTFQARISSAVDKVFFFVGYFLQVIASFFHVNVAGRAGANAATIVVEMHISIFCYF
jgi:hypothetical protein